MFYVQLEPEEALDNAGKESEEVFGKPTVLSDGKHSKSHPETDYGDEKDKNIVRTEKEMTTGKVSKNRHLTKSIVQHHALNKMLYIDLPKSEVLEKEGETHCFKESEDDVQNNFEKLFDPGEVAIGHPSLHIENCENSVNEDEIRKEDIHIKKKNAILQELLQAEQNYLNDLLKLSFLISEMFQAIDDPNHPIQIPESLKRIQCDDFKNIYEICDFHKDILTHGLIVCKDNAIDMRDLFRSRKHMLKDIYGRFCIKMRNCEYILETYQDSYFEPLKHHLNLDFWLQDQLIKPVQMLNRYPLFFRELTNICEKIGEVDNAILYDECQTMSKEVCLNTNDRLATGSIKNFPKTEEINELEGLGD